MKGAGLASEAHRLNRPDSADDCLPTRGLRHDTTPNLTTTKCHEAEDAASTLGDRVYDTSDRMLMTTTRVTAALAGHARRVVNPGASAMDT